MARRRSPTCRIVTLGVTSGVATWPAIIGPPTTDMAAWSSSEARRTTMVSPPTDAECTPSSGVSCSTRSSDQRQTDVRVASSIGLAVNTTRSSPTSATARMCRSSGVTGVPPTRSRRRPSVSEHTTTRPSASRRESPVPAPPTRRRDRSTRLPWPPTVGRRRGPRCAAGHEDAARAAGLVVPRRLREVGQIVAVPPDFGARAVELQDPRA